MKEILLKATHRSVIGKQVKALRRQGLLPAVLYGRGFEPTPVVFDLKETTHTLSFVASSTLVTIELDGEKHLALVREKQRDYIRNILKHIDFQLVSMQDKIRVNVPLELVGESWAVKNLNGIMVANISFIEVECLPQDLVDKITVDVSVMKTIGANILVRDLAIANTITVLTDPTEVIVVVTGQAAEEAAEGAAEIEPEVIEKGKKEEEA